MNARRSMRRRLRLAAMLVIAVALAMFACTTYDEAAPATGDGGVVEGGSGDANETTDGGGGGDAAAGDARCQPGSAFGTPTEITELTTDLDDNRPSLSPDELRIYFEREDFDGGITIMVASRPDLATPFGPAKVLGGFESGAVGDPSISADELTIFFSYYPATAPRDIYTATRNSKTGDFGLGQPVPTLQTSEEDTHPFLSYDGTELWFVSRQAPSLGDRDLWMARRGSNGIEAPTHVVELSSDAEEGKATLSPDGLEIFFGSRRPGSLDRDIWSARRASKNDPWGSITNVISLNTPYEEQPGWLSLDGCRMYFATNRKAGDPTAKRDLWVASRAP